ncbi:MAG: ElyC/SanA/YdcF family protein [Patescibacteria group bacterium]|jgi:hypothetical protein
MNKKHSFDIVYGLAFNIERAETKSGFLPRGCGNANDNYYFELRLRGFAEMLRLGFCKKLCIAGADEKISETETVNRAFAITQMLIHDYGISEDQLEWIDSLPSTDGNLIAIKKHMEQSNLQSAIVTNDYHIPRSSLFAHAHDIVAPFYPAEAFLLATKQMVPTDLEKAFGEGLLVQRCVAGIKGISDMLLGQYSPEERKVLSQHR